MLNCFILDCGTISHFQGFWIVQTFISGFLAILFLQSSLDKVFDFKGNMSWLKEHFGKTFMSGMVPILLTLLTITEFAAGAASLAGVVQVVVFRSYCLAFVGTALSAISLLMLFFGQRIAKDYVGAASLVPYFLLIVINLYFLA